MEITDPVWLYRGDINQLGEMIDRSQLPPAVENLSILHTIDRVHSGEQGEPLHEVTSIDVFLLS